MTLSVKCVEKVKTETQSTTEYYVMLKKVYEDSEVKDAKIKLDCNNKQFDWFDTGLVYELTIKLRGFDAVL